MKSLRSHSVEAAPKVSAHSRFGKYKPEEGQIVRTAEISGVELEQLRRKREFLRSITPEQALQVIEFHHENEKLNLFEALALAKRDGKILVPNYVIDQILTETNAKTSTLWTGTFVIYTAPERAFREKIGFS
jgi:hypothetical protein